jgi:tetratricopeptide (TPR) repeat protein
MEGSARPPIRRLLACLAACGLVTTAIPVGSAQGGEPPGNADPLLTPGGRLCGPATGGPPALLKAFILARTETAPFQPAPMKAAESEPPLFEGLGSLSLKVGTTVPAAQRYFDQGLRLTFAFNHAEAQRAFRAAQARDPGCAMCFWGESLVLGPNINAPMMPEAQAPALEALGKAVALAKKQAPARDRALIEALAARYSADPKAERAALDAAYADAMGKVAARWPDDPTILSLHAEAMMDTQPWDYWEAAGARPKGRGAAIVAALEKALARNPSHPGAIHLYIHAMEASTKPEKALAPASRLAAQMPAAGHIVHMPAHIYYRLGMYRESLEANRKAIAIDERYFASSPSDPLYKSAYYPHNIHFAMVSAQMGGDGRTAIEAATKLDAAMPVDVVKQFPIMQPVKASPYTTHAQFADPDATLKLPAPAPGLVLVSANYHYARAVAHAAKKDAAGAKREIAALDKLGKETDFKPFGEWGIPAKEIVQTAKLVAEGRLADAMGDLDGAARAYEDAIFIEDSLAYMEPPYWYYPVRQSLGSVRLRQGRLDEAEKAFRESLARVRGNGWALAGLAETYRRKGDAKSEAATRKAFARAWFGEKAPDIAKL